MPYQRQSAVGVVFNEETIFGTLAPAAGGTVLEVSGGSARLERRSVQSRLARRDGLRRRGGHGSQQATGSYSSELILGMGDRIMEAVMRGTWSAADLTLTEVSGAPALTSITTGTHTIVAGDGSWITNGLRIGDIFRLGNHAQAANNGRNLSITDLSATTITVAETLTPDATPDTAFSVVRPGRTLINPATVVRRSFSISEQSLDIDKEKIVTGARWSSIRLSMQVDGTVEVTYGFVGRDLVIREAGDSPYFTTPAEPTGVPLQVADATILVPGWDDLIDLSSFDLTLDLGAAAPPVFGKSRTAAGYGGLPPDVFDGTLSIGGSLTLLEADYQALQDFLAETPLSLHVLCEGQGSDPLPFFKLFVPNLTLAGVDSGDVRQDGGPRTQTVRIDPALVGVDDRGGAWDRTMAKIQVSNAA